MFVKYSQVYANTDVLSPIDREALRIIGEVAKLTSSSRVIELASGKGAFARFLARRFGCRVDGFDADSDFVKYSMSKVIEQGLNSLIDFRCRDINSLKVRAPYIFREAHKLKTVNCEASTCQLCVTFYHAVDKLQGTGPILRII